MGPYILGFGILCGVMCYGLLRRARWMWYLGWVILWLFVARYSLRLAAALYVASSLRDVGFALLHFTGALIIWFLAQRWWGRNSHLFDGEGSIPPDEVE